MDSDSYSTYDAKARFSELLRKVRRGRSVTITYRGEPVAELRPIDRAVGTEARIRELAARGIVTPGPAANEAAPAGEDRRSFAPIGIRRGALRRFLAEREDS